MRTGNAPRLSYERSQFALHRGAAHSVLFTSYTTPQRSSINFIGKFPPYAEGAKLSDWCGWNNLGLQGSTSAPWKNASEVNIQKVLLLVELAASLTDSSAPQNVWLVCCWRGPSVCFPLWSLPAGIMPSSPLWNLQTWTRLSFHICLLHPLPLTLGEQTPLSLF